jgi:hypothetical protein
MEKAGARLLAAALVAAGVSAGCSHMEVSASSGTASRLSSSSNAGTSVSSSSAGLHVQSDSSALATALIAISLLAGAIELSHEDRPFPSPKALVSDRPEPAPDMAPGRRVNEQDCSKPVDFFAGNLRCK